jgi:hypothetical protein
LEAVDLERTTLLVLRAPCWREIRTHCGRKLAGDYLPDETPVRRAYGVLAGRPGEEAFVIDRVFPFKRNLRGEEPYKSYMDRIMEQYAVPSKTPLDKRGWITDPVELKACYEACEREGLTVAGVYHMHVVPWEHDPLRDTPTRLDAILAANSCLFTFIVSMVDAEVPRIRGFYEGLKEKEVSLRIEEHPQD